MNLILTKYITIIKNNFLYFIIGMLGIVILLQRCDSGDPVLPVTKVVKHVRYIPIKGETVTRPGIVRTIPGKPEIHYKPDPNYNNLIKQYNELVKAYTAINIQRDSIRIDSIGYVNIEDTVSKNIITGRKVRYNFNIPETTIIKTIREPAANRTQLYYGFGVEGTRNVLIDQFNLGLLLKTKRDNIYNVYTGIDQDMQLQVGVQIYWKLKLKK
jgi:hypothetical protein